MIMLTIWPYQNSFAKYMWPLPWRWVLHYSLRALDLVWSQTKIGYEDDVSRLRRWYDFSHDVSPKDGFYWLRNKTKDKGLGEVWDEHSGRFRWGLALQTAKIIWSLTTSTLSLLGRKQVFISFTEKQPSMINILDFSRSSLCAQGPLVLYKGAYCWAWPPEIDSQNPHGGKNEQIPLTSTYVS